MAEYIKRDAIKVRLEDLVGWCQDLRKPGLEQALAMLIEEPAADVAPVVRCKDCKHYLIADEFEGGKRYMCEVNHFSYINSDGDMRYCSYGERKDDEHEH